jgi:hypothetical protein
MDRINLFAGAFVQNTFDGITSPLKPERARPKPFRWNYTRFGMIDTTAALPYETIGMTVVKHNAALNGSNQWVINGETFSIQTMKPDVTLHEGRRYRPQLHSASGDAHLIHPRWHSFEATHWGGKSTAGRHQKRCDGGGLSEG